MEPAVTRDTSLFSNLTFENNETQDSSTFKEEVETYMTYKVASLINRYWVPIVIPIGLIGNSFSFLIVMKPKNRKMSTCIYMAAISINDNVMMFSSFHCWLVSGINLYKWYLWECKLTAFVHFFGLQNGTFQVLSMTLDKYIAIKWPHRAASYSTPIRARFIALGVFVFTLTYNIPHYFAASLLGGQCLGSIVGGTITRVYSWISFVVNVMIPFSMLIYMNSVIVKTVRKSRTLFQDNPTPSTGKYPNAKQGTDKRQRTIKGVENQLIIMLLMVTILFLILLIPTHIRYIYLMLVKIDTPIKYARSMLIFQVTAKLYVTNSGVNFFLYCMKISE